MNDTGSVIRAARIRKKMTQEELGAMIGVQKSAIAKYESGRVVNIKRSTLLKLAKALDLKGSDLIMVDDPEGLADFHARVLNDGVVMDMIEKYYKLSPVNKKAVRDLVDTLSKV